MSWMDTVKGIFAGAPADPTASRGLFHASGAAGEVLDALRGVIDPELGVDVVHLGMVRAVTVEDNVAHVRLTPTTEGCPLAAWLVGACSQAIAELGFEPSVRIVDDPPWSPADIEGSAASSKGVTRA